MVVHGARGAGIGVVGFFDDIFKLVVFSINNNKPEKNHNSI